MSTTVERLNAALEGRYRIGRELGEGGMATVFLADDLRHERKVALKVLKPELAAVIGAERFLTEIKTTANLQHPHILPLFDSGEAGTFLFYVMPYVEGESLRERLDRERQLPVGEAVRIASDVAEALQYAHDRGVIHRDIKPANILLQSGRPVISDFGIALAVRAGGAHRLTETGLSVGTPQYMSPEQATGDEQVGAATDIYGLGCVLYEMLVGEPPYTGSTPQAILGKVIAGDVAPPSELRASVPANVDDAVRTALERIAADRFVGGMQFAQALGDPAFRARRSAGAPSLSRSLWNPLSIGATAVAGMAIVALVATWVGVARSGGPPAAQGVTRLSVSLAGDHRLSLAEFESFPLTVSPDGRLIAYVGESPAGKQLYLRPLSSFESVPLPETGDARQPFFSWNGEWIAYFTRSGLARVPTSGGAPIPIAALPLRPGTEVPVQPTGGAWGRDGTIVFATGEALWRVSSSGGQPDSVAIVLVDADGVTPWQPQPLDVLPDVESTVLALGWPSFLPPIRGGGGSGRVLLGLDGELSVISLEDGVARRLGVRATGHGVYARSGHLVYTQSTGEARAIPFDAETLQVDGSAVPVLDNVFRGNQTDATLLAMSETGTLVFVPGGAQRRLALVDRSGHETLLPFEARAYRFPALSPDAGRIVVTARGEGLRMLDLASGADRAVATTNTNLAVWSPTGDEIAYGSGPSRLRATPGAVPERIVEAPTGTYAMGWGRDDRILLVQPTARRDTRGGIYIASIGSGEPAATVLDTPSDERDAKRSPDGRWIAYTSDVTGRQEVYVRDLDGVGDPVAVSISGGNDPIWSTTGDELFFWSGEQAFAARVTSTDPLVVSAPEPLFTGRYFMDGSTSWDVSPSGEFLLISAGPNWLREILVVQNFHEELNGVVPAQ